jgi:hypothetical protein
MAHSGKVILKVTVVVVVGVVAVALSRMVAVVAWAHMMGP